jgi:hypothetical protein
MVSSVDVTLPEAVWLLTYFNPATGVRQRNGGRFGDVFSAVGCAALLELLSLRSITLSGIGTVKYARTLVYPGDVVPKDRGLARAHELVAVQRKPRRASSLFSKIYFALDLPTELGAKGLVALDTTGRNSELTPAGIAKVGELRSALAGDYGANLAAVIVRGELLGVVVPDTSSADADHYRDRSVAAPISGYLLLEALGDITSQSSAV